MLSISLLLLILSTFLYFGLVQKSLALELGSVEDITSDFYRKPEYRDRQVSIQHYQ
jgi:hypothetical protein